MQKLDFEQFVLKPFRLFSLLIGVLAFFTVNNLDAQAPLPIPPPDVSVQCASDVPPPVDLTDIQVSCGGWGYIPTSPTDEVTPGSCPNDFVIQRTWTFIDTCSVPPRTVSQAITVQDNIAPVAICQDLTVALNAGGVAIIDPEDVNVGSSDNCGTITKSINVSSFGCADVGANPVPLVTLTITDECGNQASCTATVTVQDITPPTPTCQDITVTRPQNLNVMISPDDVITSATDNCAINPNLTDVIPNNFSADGVFNVTASVSDYNGNVGTCTATVTVVSPCNPPSISCPANITINCTESSEPSNTGQPTWTGGCGLVTSTPTDVETPGNCASDYTITRTWTATDDESNTATCVQMITVQDIPPSASCQDITVQLGENEEVTITASQIDNGSDDACGSVSLGIDVTSFDCYDLGDHTVTLTVTDDCGNVSSCTATVTVEGPDEDCDTVADICDECPGGDDTIDNNGDGLPDCKYYPGYENLIDDWKCGNNKVYMCHAPPGNPNNRSTICVNKNAVASHMAHGDYLGPCDDANCNDPQGFVSNPTQEVHGVYQNILHLEVMPNLFNVETNISFRLDHEEHVVVEIYNLNGQMINQLHSGMLSSGTHKLSWNGNSSDGNQLESGIYFVILKTNEQVITKKVSLIK